MRDREFIEHVVGFFHSFMESPPPPEAQANAVRLATRLHEVLGGQRALDGLLGTGITLGILVYHLTEGSSPAVLRDQRNHDAIALVAGVAVAQLRAMDLTRAVSPPPSAEMDALAADLLRAITAGAKTRTPQG